MTAAVTASGADQTRLAATGFSAEPSTFAGTAGRLTGVLTVALSFVTKRNRTDAELTGLVYSLTPKLEAAEEEELGNL